MIDRSIRRDTIWYILGATSEGRRLLPDYPNPPLSWLNNVLVEEDEAVSAWLLSNPVIEDLLDLLIYCHHPNKVSRELTRALQGYPYLPPGSVDTWSNEWHAREMLRGVEFDPDRRPPDARADPRPADQAGEQQGGDESDALLAALSGRSSDASGAGDGREGSVKMFSSPGGEGMESPAKRIPLALKSSSRLNIQQSAEL